MGSSELEELVMSPGFWALGFGCLGEGQMVSHDKFCCDHHKHWESASVAVVIC